MVLVRPRTRLEALWMHLRSANGRRTLFTALIYGVWLGMEVSYAASLCMPPPPPHLGMFAAPPISRFYV